MTNTSKYMSILAKVMCNEKLHEPNTDKEKYNELYYKIHSDLNSQLRKSTYPHTTDAVQKFENMMEALEVFYLFPEVAEKKCLLISSHITTGVFSVCKEVLLDQDFISLFNKIYTQIPFVIVNGEENTIEVLNYANVRINLTINELKFLIIESGKRKIALHKVIKYFFLKTRLIDSSLCLIFDNLYGKAEGSFSRSISRCIAYIDDNDLNNIEKRSLKGFDRLLMSNENKEHFLRRLPFNKLPIITFDGIFDYIRMEVKVVLYGFFDEFTSIKMQIKDYYEEQISNSKSILQEVVGDIVRLEERGDQTLLSVRKYEEGRESRLRGEAKGIDNILLEMEKLIIDVCHDLGENYLIDKEISRFVLDNIFESIFRCRDFNGGIGKKLFSRLYSFEYDNYDLVSAFTQKKSGMKSKIDYQLINIEQSEWEKAKMLIYILEPDNVPQSYLKKYIQILGERCCTGKELYAKSLVSGDNIKGDLLQASFEKGYEKAGLILLNEYKKGDQSINLLSLVNALVPEACMIKAEEGKKNYQRRKNFVDLSDREFTYYKLAATKEYLPAVGKIVDSVFQSRFSSGFQIPKEDLNNNKYQEMIENGKIIIQLCQFLIEKLYQVEHYSEVLGIVLFSLNENLSGAMSLLTKAKSGIAYYCKGNMYEFGGGVAIDINKAIDNYERALQNGFYERVEKRLDACHGKLSKIIYESNRYNNYQSDRSYHSTSTRSSSYSSSDGCFAPGTRILMEDGTYKSVEIVKVNDRVKVYDHYKGCLSSESIIANVHDVATAKKYSIIFLQFDKDKVLKIVKSHILFDFTENRYVWIDDRNVSEYLGHEFAVYEDGEIKGYRLLRYSKEVRETYYYVPISKYHLNIFAEDFLTMPPTKFTENMFPIKEDLSYDLSVMDEVRKTSYEEVSEMISAEEFFDLPCEYLAGVMSLKKCTLEDFKYVMELYREQRRYINNYSIP